MANKPKMNANASAEETIIACAAQWGKPDWKRGKVVLKAKDGSESLVKFHNLPANAIVVVPEED